MPSLSDDSAAGIGRSGLSVLVLQSVPGSFGIGFAATPFSAQAGIKACFTSDPTLTLAVEFPQSGESRQCTFGLVDGCTDSLMDGCTDKLMDGLTAEPLRAFSLDVLSPFDFGGLAYDPLGSIATSEARLAAESTGRPPDGSGSQGNDGLMALWAALEADLYRFAKDPGFTAAVDAAATSQPEEYRRFARLNDLYRDVVKLLVPYGSAPRRWTAWLRGQEYRPFLPVGLSSRLEEFLGGRTGQPEKALDSLTRLLVRYGALLLLEQD